MIVLASAKLTSEAGFVAVAVTNFSRLTISGQTEAYPCFHADTLFMVGLVSVPLKPSITVLATMTPYLQ